MQRLGFLLLAGLDPVANKKDTVKRGSLGSECAERTWGPCTPSSKNCERKKENAKECLGHSAQFEVLGESKRPGLCQGPPFAGVIGC
uniref:Uncharacterized protein n=1 Tax=Sus scrofa TaxID=9823 RepID=A0A8D1K028_PIG